MAAKQGYTIHDLHGHDGADEGEKKYGDVKFADPADHKYPIDTDEHIRAAESYIGMPKNRAALGDKAAEVKANIDRAAREHSIGDH